jgi:hypothetical protein
VAETRKIAIARMKGYFLSLTRFWTNIIAICFFFVSFWEREFKQLPRIEIHIDFGSETKRNDGIQSGRERMTFNKKGRERMTFNKKRRCFNIYIYI